MLKSTDYSDMFIDRFYTDKDAEGKFVMHQGKVLKFNYEGSITHLMITKIDRKNKKVWAKEIHLYDMNTGMTHYGHDVVETPDERIYCKDCEIEIDQPATEEGEVKAIMRDREEGDE